jgi:hypothetical protein
LTTVANGLFVTLEDTTAMPSSTRNLVEELQLIFAKLEYANDFEPTSKSTLIDTRGLVRELGLTNGGLSSRVSPDGLYVVFFEALKKCVVSEMLGDEGVLEETISGTFSDGGNSFTHIRVNPNTGKSITSLD